MKKYKIIETWFNGYDASTDAVYSYEQALIALGWLKVNRGHYENIRIVEL